MKYRIKVPKFNYSFPWFADIYLSGVGSVRFLNLGILKLFWCVEIRPILYTEKVSFVYSFTNAYFLGLTTLLNYPRFCETHEVVGSVTPGPRAVRVYSERAAVVLVKHNKSKK